MRLTIRWGHTVKQRAPKKHSGRVSFHYYLRNLSPTLEKPTSKKKKEYSLKLKRITEKIYRAYVVLQVNSSVS